MLEKKPVELLLATIVGQASNARLSNGTYELARRVNVHRSGAQHGVQVTKRLHLGRLETRRDRVDTK